MIVRHAPAESHSAGGSSSPLHHRWEFPPLAYRRFWAAGQSVSIDAIIDRVVDDGDAGTAGGAYDAADVEATSFGMSGWIIARRELPAG
jgi:hypothetical protein